jgi:hypothetical protein
MAEAYIDADEAFLRQLVLPEEDRLRLHPTVQWTAAGSDRQMSSR